MLLNKIKDLFNKSGKSSGNKSANAYKNMEIEAVIKRAPSIAGTSYTLELIVLDQGSFFTKDIFVQHVDDTSRTELFYNYSALGMNKEELQRFGAAHKGMYRFQTLEEAKKAKDTTIQYIRFLIREHEQMLQTQKIS